MKCPVHGATLEKMTVGDEVEVDTCPVGGGMYLDRGELDKLATPHSGDLEFSTVDLDTFAHEDDHGVIECPADPGVEMKKVEFNIYTNIILDYCERCRGFWVSAAELARINEIVEDLDEAEQEVYDPPMLWFAKFLWGLPFPK
ncbi:MAG: zf-TFIIB domain-containing protein [Thermoanaerobaculia bacterium]|nr:zf-TFIIB domain-containing protein [Thermoanaerobaculia bacterium]